jgi:tRNA-specific 2-thiouridylase
LGEYRKPEVRELARRYGLRVAEKVESQEICFVESGSIEEYIRSRQQERGGTDHPGLKPGEVVDTLGRKVGEHHGAAFYTIGQRKGLGVSLGKPAYITSVDTAAGRIVLGEGEDLLGAQLEAAPVNYLTEPPDGPFRAEVQIRYRSRPVAATVIPNGPNSVKVTMDQPQRAIAPGQSVVFYNGSVVIGGGVICSAS